MSTAEIFGISIQSVRDGSDGIDFDVVVKNREQTLTYQGTATRSALAQIDGSRDPMAAFDAHKGGFLAAIARDWRSQPETDRVVINSQKLVAGSTFVGNG